MKEQDSGESRYPWEGKGCSSCFSKAERFYINNPYSGYIKNKKEHHLQVTINGEPVCVRPQFERLSVYKSNMEKKGDTNKLYDNNWWYMQM